MALIKINNTVISNNNTPYVVAELSGNHNGSIDKAMALVKASKEAGANAIKLQTYTPDTITMDCNKSEFIVKEGLWAGRTLYDLYKEAHMPWEWQEKIFKYAGNLGLDYFSTPFDETAVDFLNSIGTMAWKIASYEANETNLLKYVKNNKNDKPIIVSTGNATYADMLYLDKLFKDNIAFLHCVSEYPSSIQKANLSVILSLKDAFPHIPIGLSDHSLSPAIPLAATMLGACIIEKHITLDRSDGGVDCAFSLEPHEFKIMCEHVHNKNKILGNGSFLSSREVKLSRSLYAVRLIKNGELFTKHNVKSIRPGYGLSVDFYDFVIGKRATSDIEPGTALWVDAIKGFSHD